MGCILVALVKAVRGGSPAHRRLDAEEARLMQEIHRGLERLDERVEALEILLNDRKENVRHDHHK